MSWRWQNGRQLRKPLKVPGERRWWLRPRQQCQEVCRRRTDSEPFRDSVSVFGEDSWWKLGPSASFRLPVLSQGARLAPGPRGQALGRAAEWDSPWSPAVLAALTTEDETCGTDTQ